MHFYNISKWANEAIAAWRSFFFVFDGRSNDSDNFDFILFYCIVGRSFEEARQESATIEKKKRF